MKTSQVQFQINKWLFQLHWNWRMAKRVTLPKHLRQYKKRIQKGLYGVIVD